MASLVIYEVCAYGTGPSLQGTLDLSLGETEDEDEEMGGSNLPGDLSSELSEDDFEM